MPGPIPAPTGQRRRRNKASSVLSTGTARPSSSPEPDPSWHPIATDWYLAFRTSGQVDYFQDTDWQTARVAAHMLSEQLQASRMSATAMAEWSSVSIRLMATEGDRRRLRLELERVPVAADGPDEVEDELDKHRARRSVKSTSDAAGGSA